MLPTSLLALVPSHSSPGSQLVASPQSCLLSALASLAHWPSVLLLHPLLSGLHTWTLYCSWFFVPGSLLCMVNKAPWKYHTKEPFLLLLTLDTTLRVSIRCALSYPFSWQRCFWKGSGLGSSCYAAAAGPRILLIAENKGKWEKNPSTVCALPSRGIIIKTKLFVHISKNVIEADVLWKNPAGQKAIQKSKVM